MLYATAFPKPRLVDLDQSESSDALALNQNGCSPFSACRRCQRDHFIFPIHLEQNAIMSHKNYVFIFFFYLHPIIFRSEERFFPHRLILVHHHWADGRRRSDLCSASKKNLNDAQILIFHGIWGHLGGPSSSPLPPPTTLNPRRHIVFV